MSITLANAGVRRAFFGIKSGNAIKSELTSLVKQKSLPNAVKQLGSPQTYGGPLDVPTLEESCNEFKKLLLTLKVRGNDVTVLDNYTQFMRRVASVLNLDVSGRMTNMNAETFPMGRSGPLLEAAHVHSTTGNMGLANLYTHTRVLQVRDMTNETADVFLDYVQNNLPEGVSIVIEQTNIGPFLEYIRSYNTENNDLQQ